MLHKVDLVATVISLLEICAKIVGHGLLMSPTSFLRSQWNIFDGFVVLLTLFEDVVEPSHASVTMLLRTMHALRPVRAIGRFGGLRMLVKLLGLMWSRVLNVVAVYLLFLLVFSLLGVQLYAGTS